jgi:hypothetical protein
MGHARCEKLMGFNMGLVSVRGSREAVMLDSGCSSHILSESCFQAKWEMYRVWETITQTLQSDKLMM